MTPSSLAGAVTAFATVITALGGLVMAFGVLIPILRTTRSTHVIVNQQRTDMLRREAALKKLLAFHGIEIPEDPSVEELG